MSLRFSNAIKRVSNAALAKNPYKGTVNNIYSRLVHNIIPKKDFKHIDNSFYQQTLSNTGKNALKFRNLNGIYHQKFQNHKSPHHIFAIAASPSSVVITHHPLSHRRDINNEVLLRSSLQEQAINEKVAQYMKENSSNIDDIPPPLLTPQGSFTPKLLFNYMLYHIKRTLCYIFPDNLSTIVSRVYSLLLYPLGNAVIGFAALNALAFISVLVIPSLTWQMFWKLLLYGEIMPTFIYSCISGSYCASMCIGYGYHMLQYEIVQYTYRLIRYLRKVTPINMPYYILGYTIPPLYKLYLYIENLLRTKIEETIKQQKEDRLKTYELPNDPELATEEIAKIAFTDNETDQERNIREALSHLSEDDFEKMSVNELRQITALISGKQTPRIIELQALQDNNLSYNNNDLVGLTPREIERKDERDDVRQQYEKEQLSIQEKRRLVEAWQHNETIDHDATLTTTGSGRDITKTRFGRALTQNEMQDLYKWYTSLPEDIRLDAVRFIDNLPLKQQPVANIFIIAENISIDKLGKGIQFGRYDDIDDSTNVQYDDNVIMLSSNARKRAKEDEEYKYNKNKQYPDLSLNKQEEREATKFIKNQSNQY